MENIQKENLENITPISSSIEMQWQTEVTTLLPNLLYPSESDEPLEWVEIPQAYTSPLNTNDLLVCFSLPEGIQIEEVLIEKFWSPVITIEDWYGEEEKQQVEQYMQLKNVLEIQLKNFQAFRVGQTEIDLYLLGQAANETWAGLKTKIIET